MFSSPEGAVQQAFDAYASGNSDGVSEQLSPQGLANASLFCGGQASECLAQNYRQFGKSLSTGVSVSEKTDTSARVLLKTTWAGYPTALCQTYSVDRTKDGWKITYFDVPRNC